MIFCSATELDDIPVPFALFWPSVSIKPGGTVETVFGAWVPLNDFWKLGKFLGRISRIEPGAIVRIRQFELNNAGVTHITNLAVEFDLHVDSESRRQILIRCALCNAELPRIFPALRFD